MRPDESFVEQPIRSLQTMLRVLALDDNRYLLLVPDGIYGPETANAVTAFQRQNNIPISGIADQVTWEAIAAAYEPAIVRVGKAEKIEILLEPGVVFTLGDTDPHIYLIQAMLAQLADEHKQIPRPAHSGTLDELTARSLQAFQRYAGLPENGNADRVTWKNLSRQFTLSAHHAVNG
ncbi:MAG: peptidoglycan-binding protein [Oscillospiraceae bacterium]|nr:peptidoglycan-binding protein [Oscillospiraceae bacterium]